MVNLNVTLISLELIMNLEIATIENISVLTDCDTKAQGLYAELKFQKDGTVTETRMAIMPTLESLLNHWDETNINTTFDDIKQQILTIQHIWKSKNLNGYKDLNGKMVVCKMSGNSVQDIDWNPTIDGLSIRSKFDEDANLS